MFNGCGADTVAIAATPAYGAVRLLDDGVCVAEDGATTVLPRSAGGVDGATLVGPPEGVHAGGVMGCISSAACLDGLGDNCMSSLGGSTGGVRTGAELGTPAAMLWYWE